jgi:hypothetical protein
MRVAGGVTGFTPPVKVGVFKSPTSWRDNGGFGSRTPRSTASIDRPGHLASASLWDDTHGPKVLDEWAELRLRGRHGDDPSDAEVALRVEHRHPRGLQGALMSAPGR